ncbi:hypothetical protein GCM10027062_10220 [Nocardioides hungaricus]
MTEPQSWTLIIGFLAAVSALLGIITTSFHRTLRTEIGSVRTELRSEIGSVRTELRTEIGSVRTEMRAEFRRMDERLDHLDRDVQALTRHIFDRPE